MKMLDHSCLDAVQFRNYEQIVDSPVKILQIGEGNFLRGYFDWMVQQSIKQGLFEGSIAVTQPRPHGRAKLVQLRDQDGLFTHVARGLEDGVKVERKEVISVFSKLIDPYEEWEQFLALADLSELQFVVSNTTEAGLSYWPETFISGQPIESFPGKLTLLLYRRFQVFSGDPEKGLIMLPFELLENNGEVLRTCVLRYCEDWHLPENFRSWVLSHNRFLNTLVDRIVTGYPEAEANEWFANWGYRDEALCTSEPYHFLAIEGEPELDERLPLVKAGLNVHWVSDLSSYRLRKVRLLNGAHTVMTPLALLNGFEHVREVMEDDKLGSFVRRVIEEEIIPSVSLPEQELKSYTDTVVERFLNPFIDHRLIDIAMNSISKFKVRVLPSLLYYNERESRVPDGLATAFAALLRLYKTEKTTEGYFGTAFTGNRYLLKDDPIVLETLHDGWLKEKKWETVQLAKYLLGLTNVWGADLSAIGGLAEAIAQQWSEMGDVG